MTRKDFNLIAETIKNCTDLDDIEREALAKKFAIALLGTNPNFQPGRFIDACLK